MIQYYFIFGEIIISNSKENLIGKIFFKKGILTYEQVNTVYDYSIVNGIKFASAAIKLGYSTEQEALICLTEQIGFPGIELKNSKFHVYKELIPFEIAIEKRILPLKVSEKNLIIAISDPYDKVLIDEISFLTGKKVIAYLAIEDILLKVIQDVYSTEKTFYKSENYKSDDFFLSVISPSVMSFMEQDEDTDDLIVGEILEEEEEEVSVGEFEETEKTVLIVDDEEDILKLISKVVKKLNMKPVTINNGSDAIKAINRSLPDLIILDAMLPGKHGFEICKEIKESETLSSIPVLIISAIYKGWQFEKDIVNIYKANKFLEKPFRISVLMDTIKELIAVNEDVIIPNEDGKLDQILSLSAKLINKGDFGNAQKILEHAVKVAPFYYKFRYLLGYTCLIRGNNYMAISELEAAVDINRKFFPAIKELAVLYEKMGFRNKAIEKWQIAIEATEDKSVKEKIKKHLIDLVSTI